MDIRDKDTVTATQLQKHLGTWMDQALKAPVFITKHRRPARVLLDIEEYDRLKSLDTRQALWAHEIGPEDLDAIKSSEMDKRHDHLNEEVE